jgi:hypothetical protein
MRRWTVSPIDLDSRAGGAGRRITAQPSTPRRATGTLSLVIDALSELTECLDGTVQRLRAGELEPDAVLALVEECARLATEASAELVQRTRAAVEPLPDLPGQLPLPAG